MKKRSRFLCLLVAGSLPVLADVIDNSLVLRYDFAAAPVNDVILDTNPGSTKHPGTNVNATWVASEAGRHGVMTFVAPAVPYSQITVPASPDFNSTVGTISFWLKTPGNVGGGREGAIVFDRRTSSGDVIVVYDDGTVFIQNGGAGTTLNTSSVVTDDQWHNITYVYDASETGLIALYVDGQLDVTQSNTRAWSWPAAQPIELGKSHDGYWRAYNGLLSDFLIYKRVLSDAEILGVKNGSPPVDGDLVLRFRFASPPTNGTVADTSPAGNHPGTVVNAAWVDQADGRTGAMRFAWPESTQIGVEPSAELADPVGTIAFWLKSAGNVGSGSEGAILFDWRGTTGDWIVAYNDGRMFVQASNGSVVNQFWGTTPVLDGAWHHVAYVFNQNFEGTIQIYVDGTLDGSQANSDGWSWPLDEPILLGQSNDPYWRAFNGAMDDFRQYNRGLSDAEIRSVYLGDGVDTQPPLFQSFSFVVTTNVTMRLVFDEPLDPATAGDARTYKFSGGTTITSVAAQGKNVLLALKGLLPFDNFTLTVSGIKDLFGNTLVSTNIAGTAPFYELNWARGGIASSQSVYGGWAPSRAIDGNRSGSGADNSMFHSNNNENEWWEVDLGEPKPIGQIRVFFRTDCCPDRNMNLRIVVYDTPDLRNEVYTQDIPGMPLESVAYGICPFVTGQIVRVEHPVGITQFLGLAEVEVLAPNQGVIRMVQDPLGATVQEDSNLSLVSVVGGNCIAYQWQLNGQDLAGKTDPTLVLNAIQLGQAGSYTVVARDASGSVTSAPAVVVVTPLPAANPDDNLVARYDFDAAPDNSVVLDSGPKGNRHPAANIDATWVDQIEGRSGLMQFLGDPGNQVVIPAHADFNTATGTIMFWFKTGGANGPGQEAMLIFDRRTSSGDVIGLNSTDGTGYCQNNSAGITLKTPEAMNDNQWHHMAYRYDQSAAGGITFYIDGKFSTTRSNKKAWQWPAAQQLELGRSHDGYWNRFDGYLDDVRFYNRALYSREIAAIVNPPVRLAYAFAAGKLTLTWTQAGFALQENNNLSNAAGWKSVPGGSASPVVITVPATGNQYYRLVR